MFEQVVGIWLLSTWLVAGICCYRSVIFSPSVLIDGVCAGFLAAAVFNYMLVVFLALLALAFGAV